MVSRVHNFMIWCDTDPDMVKTETIRYAMLLINTRIVVIDSAYYFIYNTKINLKNYKKCMSMSNTVIWTAMVSILIARPCHSVL